MTQPIMKRKSKKYDEEGRNKLANHQFILVSITNYFDNEVMIIL